MKKLGNGSTYNRSQKALSTPVAGNKYQSLLFVAIFDKPFLAGRCLAYEFHTRQFYVASLNTSVTLTRAQQMSQNLTNSLRKVQ